MNFFTRVSFVLFLNPGELGILKLDIETVSDFTGSGSLGSSFLAVALFLKENFFLGINSEFKISKFCFKSEMVLREERTS